MTFNAANLGGNIYINNLIGCAFDVGSGFLVSMMLKKFSRRNAMATGFVTVACFSFLTPIVKRGTASCYGRIAMENF